MTNNYPTPIRQALSKLALEDQQSSHLAVGSG
jgi:hypothetical protein